MAEHSTITDPDIHEPKGVSTASANTAYVASGAGSGTWKKIDHDSIDMTDLESELSDAILGGDIEITGLVYLSGVIPDISTASSILIALPEDGTVKTVTLTLGGVIDTADASISVKNSSGGSMGTAVTVPYTSSAKGDTVTFTATANNVITGPSWMEVATDGASGQTIPLYVTVKFQKVLN